MKEWLLIVVLIIFLSITLYGFVERIRYCQKETGMSIPACMGTQITVPGSGR